MLKEEIQLGDIITLNDGKVYIYLQCPEVGYSMYNQCILLDLNCVNYYGSGLGNFNAELVHKFGQKIVKVRRSVSPLTFCNKRSNLKEINIRNYIENSDIIYPEENFINISLYV